MRAVPTAPQAWAAQWCPHDVGDTMVPKDAGNTTAQVELKMTANNTDKQVIRILGALLGISVAGMLSFSNCAAQAPPEPPPTISLQKDVVFDNTKDIPLLMDVVRPKVLDGALPVVICIHGGGWSAGDKKDMRHLEYGIAALGLEAVSVNYRLAPAYKFPTQIDDVKTALRYLHSHAKEMNIDANRIAAVGSSAGGQLALLLAELSADGTTALASPGHPSSLRAAISISGPTDLTQQFSQPAKGIIDSLMGFPMENNPKAYQQASPIHCLTSSCPPLLMIHGDKDDLVPYDQATRMLAACSRAGVQAELYTLHNAGHSGGGDPAEREGSLRKLAEFLNKYLKH